jgi:O-antigen/teichoic acid export membrane protein
MFWRGVIGYLPANVMQGVVGLLTIVTFTRLLSSEAFGAYALGLGVMSLVHTCLFTWNEAAMARFWAGEARKGEAAHHLATIYRLWLFLLPVLAIAAAVAVVWPITGDVRWAVLAGLTAILPKTLAKLAQERRRAAGEVAGSVALDIGQALGGFVAGAALAWAGLGGAAPLLGAGAAAALCAAFVVPSEWKRSAGGRFEPARARLYAGYGIPVSLSLILALVLATTDRFLLAAFLDEAAVGVYHAGYSLANRTLDVAFIWLGAAGAPALIMALERGGVPALRTAAREQAGVMVLVTLPAAAGLALVAQPLSEVLVGPALRAGAAQVTPWIAASGLLAGLTTYYFSQAFTLARRTKRLLGAMAIPAVANVVLNLILIPRLGLHGALVATLASYGLGLAAAIALGRGPLALPIPWRTLAEAGGATAIMALAVSRLPTLGGIVELVLKAGVGAVVYGAVAWTLDAGGLRSRAGQALGAFRARTAA